MAVRPDYQKIPALSVLSAMFLHGGLLPLAGNMLFLFVFGNNVEDRLGRARYLLFYLARGYLATYGFAISDHQHGHPGRGVGGIAGVRRLPVLSPRARVTSLVLFLFFIPGGCPPGWCSAPGSSSSGPLLPGRGHRRGARAAYLAHVVGFAAGVALIVPLGGLRAPPPPPHPRPPGTTSRARARGRGPGPADAWGAGEGRGEPEAGQERLAARGAATRGRPAARASTQAATTSRAPTSRPRQASWTSRALPAARVARAGRSAAAPTTTCPASTATSHRRSPPPVGPSSSAAAASSAVVAGADHRAGRVEQAADVGQDMVGRGGQVGQVGQPGDAAEDQRGRPAEPVGAVQVGVGPVAHHQVGAGPRTRRGPLRAGPARACPRPRAARRWPPAAGPGSPRPRARSPRGREGGVGVTPTNLAPDRMARAASLTRA